MAELPPRSVPAIVRGVGVYVRTTDANELPAKLRPVKKAGQTAKALMRHRAVLLGTLEDDAIRARILEWLDKSKPPLDKEDARALRIAVERPEDWIEQLAAMAPAGQPAPEVDTHRLEKRLEREKEAARKAKDEARRAREDKQGEVDAERARRAELERHLDETEALLGEIQEELRAARAEAAAAAKELERERRRGKAAAERFEAERERLRERARAAERELRVVGSRSGKAEPAPRKSAPKPEPKVVKRGPRKILRAPKGRFEEDPQTLDGWLDRDDVTLVVDGYNVTRHEDGFAHLDLEKQRDRLIEMLKGYVARKPAAATLVFDGSDVPPGTKRRKHGSLKVEYSKPDTSGTGAERDRADDHIVALVADLPPDPVVVVTNDRGLQERVRELRATIARSEQLLRLLR